MKANTQPPLWEVLETTRRNISVERKALKFLEQGGMDLGRIKVEGRKVPAVTIKLFSKEMK